MGGLPAGATSQTWGAVLERGPRPFRPPASRARRPLGSTVHQAEPIGAGRRLSTGAPRRRQG
eukprot:7837977-Alexandrium_andersonii.AAC.1